MRFLSLRSLARGVSLLGLTALLIGCKDDAGKPTIRHPQDFLPQILGGMAPEGPPTVATTADELRDAIDGGYQTYTDHNFQEFVQQFYQGVIRESQANVEVWIFEMVSAQDGRDLHDDDRIACSITPEVLNDIGEEGVLCSGPGSQRIWFYRDNYWSRILIYNYSFDAAEDARTIAELFAAHIDQKIME